jgi:hypothetical protein
LGTVHPSGELVVASFAEEFKDCDNLTADT